MLSFSPVEVVMGSPAGAPGTVNDGATQLAGALAGANSPSPPAAVTTTKGIAKPSLIGSSPGWRETVVARFPRSTFVTDR